MQKRGNLVDLVKSFPTSIDLQNSASIQPRTSLSKFAKNWPKVRKKVRTNIGSGAEAGRTDKASHGCSVNPRGGLGVRNFFCSLKLFCENLME